jgi:hypothetical protein
MDTWQPISTEELDAIIAAQLADCSPEQRQFFDHCKIARHLAKIDRLGTTETVFVVARAGDLVLYYEDVEGGFNISSLRPDGSIASPGYEQWELRHALWHLAAA